VGLRYRPGGNLRRTPHGRDPRGASGRPGAARLDRAEGSAAVGRGAARLTLTATSVRRKQRGTERRTNRASLLRPPTGDSVRFDVKLPRRSLPVKICQVSTAQSRVRQGTTAHRFRHAGSISSHGASAARPRKRELSAREVLIYRSTPADERSFRARLRARHVRRAKSKNQPEMRYGLREDDDRMARATSKVLEQKGVSNSTWTPSKMTSWRCSVHDRQYRLGGVGPAQHVLIGDSTGSHLSVPYDFDWAGASCRLMPTDPSSAPPPCGSASIAPYAAPESWRPCSRVQRAERGDLRVVPVSRARDSSPSASHRPRD